MKHIIQNPRYSTSIGTVSAKTMEWNHLTSLANSVQSIRETHAENMAMQNNREQNDRDFIERQHAANVQFSNKQYEDEYARTQREIMKGGKVLDRQAAKRAKAKGPELDLTSRDAQLEEQATNAGFEAMNAYWTEEDNPPVVPAQAKDEPFLADEPYARQMIRNNLTAQLIEFDRKYPRTRSWRDLR